MAAMVLHPRFSALHSETPGPPDVPSFACTLLIRRFPFDDFVMAANLLGKKTWNPEPLYCEADATDKASVLLQSLQIINTGK